MLCYWCTGRHGVGNGGCNGLRLRLLRVGVRMMTKSAVDVGDRFLLVTGWWRRGWSAARFTVFDEWRVGGRCWIAWKRRWWRRVDVGWVVDLMVVILRSVMGITVTDTVLGIGHIKLILMMVVWCGSGVPAVGCCAEIRRGTHHRCRTFNCGTTEIRNWPNSRGDGTFFTLGSPLPSERQLPYFFCFFTQYECICVYPCVCVHPLPYILHSGGETQSTNRNRSKQATVYVGADPPRFYLAPGVQNSQYEQMGVAN